MRGDKLRLRFLWNLWGVVWLGFTVAAVLYGVIPGCR
jgi:hypothetical protein